MHVRVTKEQLIELIKHKDIPHRQGALLFTVAGAPVENQPRLIGAVLMPTNGGWLPVIVPPGMTVPELEEITADVLEVSEVAG